MIDVREYLDDKGRSPFREWLHDLDLTVRGRVRTRIDRLRLGNFGDSKALGDGLHELRLDFGPGYRVYYGRLGQDIVVLFGGGDKSTQARDIKKAKEIWAQY